MDTYQKVESELNEYKKGIVDGSWLQHQCRRMIERNMNYMKSNKMDEGQEAESLKAVPSGSSNGTEASCKCTKSRGGGISGNKTNKVMSKMFSQPIEKEEKNTDKMNLAKLLDWSRKAGFPKRAKGLYRGKFHNQKIMQFRKTRLRPPRAHRPLFCLFGFIYTQFS